MAYVLAGGRGSRLMELTDRRAKPAVYFGGKSRIIDFALSNALNSGIRRIAVATQYKAHSLIRHLQRGWNFFRPERNESFDILPASQRVSETMWYLGTADAVYQNIDIIESYAPQFMVILAGDHIYKMDYEKMLQQHVESGARCDGGLPRSLARGGHGLRRDACRRERPHPLFPRKAEEPAADARQARRRAVQHGHLCLRDQFPDRGTQARRRRPELVARFRQGHHPLYRQERQGGRASLRALLRASRARRPTSTGATSERSTPIGPPISTLPTSCPISISTTAHGRSGPMARSRRRRNSCMTSTGGAAPRYLRWSRAAASSRARRSRARWSSPARASIPTRTSTRRSSCPMSASAATCG